MPPGKDRKAPAESCTPDEFQKSIERSLKGAAQADPAAVSALYQRLTPGLTRHFLRKLSGSRSVGGGGNLDLAQELTQRTWIEFWRLLQAGRYDPARACCSTFLYAIAANIWLRSLRERGRARETGATDESAMSDAAAADLANDTHELAAAIEAVRAVVDGSDSRGGFDAADRDILRAIALGASERDLAVRLEVSPSTAHERKRGILERLERYLKSRGIDEAGLVRARSKDDAKKG